MVLLPGTDKPTDTPSTGGHRFLPVGYSSTRWQWAELYQANWNPLTDPLQVVALSTLIGAPEQHGNYPKQQDSINVKDCKTGASISEETEIARVIIARVQGSTYACNPSMAP